MNMIIGNVVAEFWAHLQEFYKAGRSTHNARRLDFVQNVARCLPRNFRKGNWDLQLVALACTYLDDGGRIVDLYRHGFSTRMVEAVRLLTPCCSVSELEDGPGPFLHVLRLLRSPMACVVRLAMIAAAGKTGPSFGLGVPSKRMHDLFRDLARGELRFSRKTLYFGQFADFKLGDRSVEDVCKDVREAAFRPGAFGRMLLAAEDFPLVYDSSTDLKWGRNREGLGENRLGNLLKEVQGELAASCNFRHRPYSIESYPLLWARAGWWHKLESVRAWVELLAENPKPAYVRRCPFRRFSDGDWQNLLWWQPQLAEKQPKRRRPETDEVMTESDGFKLGWFGDATPDNTRLNLYSNSRDLSDICSPGYLDDASSCSLAVMARYRPFLFDYCLDRIAREVPWEALLHYSPFLYRRCPKAVRAKAKMATENEIAEILYND